MKVEKNEEAVCDPLSIDVDNEQSDIKPHVCRCGKAFPHPTQLMEHIKRVHLQLEDYICTECGSAFPCQSDLNDHLKINHTDPKHEEENPISLESAHVKVELDDRCSESDKTKEKLDPSKVPLYCEECGGGPFSRSSSLNKHAKDFHGKELRVRRKNDAKTMYDEYRDSEPKKCKCGRSFGRNEQLEKHIKSVHLKIRDCICDECGSAFRCPSDLNYHIRSVHHKIKNYKCSKCDSRFASQSCLKRHEAKDHIKLKARRIYQKLDKELDEYRDETEPNKCKCGTTFIRPDSFKRHVIDVHLKIRERKCDDCGSKFSNHYCLKEHIKSVHQQAYKCSKCGSIFSRNFELKKHEERAHNVKRDTTHSKIGEKEHLCDVCGVACTTKTNLNRHVKIAHPMLVLASEKAQKGVAGADRILGKDEKAEVETQEE